jgi:Cdc6-like AAA superfamily ATPase
MADARQQTLSATEKQKLIARCGRVWSPSAPVNKLDLFAGRLGQIRKITDAVNTRGRHAIMYGNRGVGKTSLANVLKDLFTDVGGMKIAKVNCVETDTFLTVWRRALDEIRIIEETSALDPEGVKRVERRLSEYLNMEAGVGPGEIRQILQHGSEEGFELVVVFDEFDRLPTSERGLFADTIKDLSDNSIDSTLVLVGVASDVMELIREHASIDRCLTQIPMPPMSREELRDIIDKALKPLGFEITDQAAELIVSLSQGLAHYTHLLGQESTYNAIHAGVATIALEDVNAGISAALDKTQQTVRNDYYKAASGQRKGTLFPDVLLACALAEVDEMGFFGSTDVRQPLQRITGKDYDIPNFSQHLDAFSTEESRGPVLEKSGTTRRFRFRFRNPLLQPFIIMKGLIDEKISGDLIQQLRAKSNSPARASDQPLLFQKRN